MVNSKIITYVSLVLVMLIWGSSFAVTKLVVKDVSPVQFAFYPALNCLSCSTPILFQFLF
jgi:hypothetical protein